MLLTIRCCWFAVETTAIAVVAIPVVFPGDTPRNYGCTYIPIHMYISIYASAFILHVKVLWKSIRFICTLHRYKGKHSTGYLQSEYIQTYASCTHISKSNSNLQCVQTMQKAFNLIKATETEQQTSNQRSTYFIYRFIY